MRTVFRYDPTAACFEETGKTITMWTLLIPMLFETIFRLMYGTANALVLSGYSQEAVSAVSVSDQLRSIAMVLLSMITKGATVTASVAIGSQNRDRAACISGTGMVLMAGFGVLCGMVLSVGSGFFLHLMNLQGDMYFIAVQYLAVAGLFLPVSVLLSYINNLLITNGYAKCTMLVGIAGNVLSVVFSWLALYSGISLPVSGVCAVALVTGISQVLCLFVSALFFWVKQCPFRWIFRKMYACSILRMGVPSGMANLSYILSQAVTTSFVAPLGYTVINAKVYVSNITNYISNISMAIGNANAVLMGRHRGAKNLDKIQSLFRQNVWIVILCNLLLSLLCFSLRDILIGLFTKEAVIISAATSILLIDVALEMGRGINHIAEGSLNANGDVWTTLIVSVFCCWASSVLLGYVLCVKVGWGLTGLWLAFAADELIRGVIYLQRWRRGKWKHIEI